MYIQINPEYIIASFEKPLTIARLKRMLKPVADKSSTIAIKKKA